MPYSPPKYRPAGWQPAEKRKHQADKARPSAAKRGYDRTWQRIRRQHLQMEPLCRFCKEAGIIKEAAHVDHIDGNAWNRDHNNLRSLCAPCHNARTARDQAFGRHPVGGSIS